MTFISFDFLILVLVTFLIYYLPFLKKIQTQVLVTSSVIFYSYDQWRLLPLLIITIYITILCLDGIEKGYKYSAAIGVIINILILGFFKYKFLICIKCLNLESKYEIIKYLLLLPLPIGISFFIFHNISLILDFNNKVRVSTSKILLYIVFFPQLICGPITRSINFIPQIQTKFLIDIPWIKCAKLIIVGLFFKLFCANNIAQVTAQMSPEISANLGGGDKILLVYFYSAQIYSDFFGYSCIALGVGLLFGYQLPINFNLPYTASSFSDFWKRWHISLSSWLLQYLYIPLGGNRMSKIRTYANLMIVMILGGFWHGAALSYAFWGLTHGFFLVVERLFNDFKNIYFKNYYFSKFQKIIYSFIVFNFISFAWIFFRFQEFENAFNYIYSISIEPFIFKLPARYLISFFYISPIIIQHLLYHKISIICSNKYLEGFFYGFVLWLSFAEQGADTQFIYFKF